MQLTSAKAIGIFVQILLVVFLVIANVTSGFDLWLVSLAAVLLSVTATVTVILRATTEGEEKISKLLKQQAQQFQLEPLIRHLGDSGVVLVAVTHVERTTPQSWALQITRDVAAALVAKGVNSQAIVNDNVLRAIKNDPGDPPDELAALVVERFARDANGRYLLWLHVDWAEGDKLHWELFGFQQKGLVYEGVAAAYGKDPGWVAFQVIESLNTITHIQCTRKELMPWQRGE